MNKELNSELGSMLKQLREKKNLSLREVARRLKKGHSTVADHENGRITISIDVLYEYCNLYDVDPSKVLSGLDYRTRLE